ncbi:microfibril-associated glycoprotein 4-like isoform X1 [Mytilus trossulus]|uniref:microfibril-associated glycoprotein 4-like isoform X1 n=1 Tax=Mytilus trossulus TaxID=6551 RepID=UPI00300622B0
MANMFCTLYYSLMRVMICDQIYSIYAEIQKGKFLMDKNINISLAGSPTKVYKEEISLIECSLRLLNNDEICVASYDTVTDMCMLYTSCFSLLIDVSNTETTLIHRDLSDLRPRDCNDIHPGSLSGVYTIYPTDEQFDVYCDMDTAGPGWTVFQRRTDGTIDFYQGWFEFEIGFGNLETEFWLGNKYVHLLTSIGKKTLYICLEDFEGNSRYAEYSDFSIGDATTNYTLNVDGYNGTAGDSLTINGTRDHNGMMFSTKDRDNDRYTDYDCAQKYKGAWWFNACHWANLNGAYLGGPHLTFADGIEWYTWKGYRYSLKSTKMMFK